MHEVSAAMEALVLGALAATTVIFTFQTRVGYPAWMMKSFDHPWLLLVVLIVSVIAYSWNPRISAMLILLVCALWMDAVMFAKHPIVQTGATAKRPEPRAAPQPQEKVPEVWPFEGKDLDAREERAIQGPTVDSVDALASPAYPVFFGDGMHPIGPAPFA